MGAVSIEVVSGRHVFKNPVAGQTEVGADADRLATAEGRGSGSGDVRGVPVRGAGGEPGAMRLVILRPNEREITRRIDTLAQCAER